MAVVNDSRQRASGLIARIQGFVDRVVSPDTRQQFYKNLGNFASNHPLLAAFLAIQLLFSITPVLLFASFVIGTIFVSFISATIFSLFWIGVALLVLVPTLFLTVSLGVMVWMWAASSFVAAKWVYNMVPASVKGEAKIEMPNGKALVVEKTGQGYGDIKAEVDHVDHAEHA